ncbi:dihydrodipicolinate synthetase family protein [Phlyctema vagabunda]|uniref:Dihydrodipicolinate synthetase family protein n=1 Tax=Phlyctema vagabunda TaxID=108571 RepID=A0ABR4PII7_9HELO
MKGLPSCSPEVLVRIYQICDDLSQVLTLASTCKYINSVLATHSSAIIYDFAKAEIRSFDDALMAVRATDLALKAYQSGCLPPLVSIQELSSASRKPNVQELQLVLNMQHLVQCIEYMFFTEDGMSNLFGYGSLPGDLREGPLEGEEEAWKDRFYRSVYRMFLAGALLSRAYLAPIFEAEKKGRTDFLSQTRTKDPIESFGGMTRRDVDFLREFSVYNFDVLNESETGIWKDSEYENIFGPFVSWLIEDGKKRPIPESSNSYGFGDTGTEDKSISGAVSELMCLITAYDYLDDVLSQKHGLDWIETEPKTSIHEGKIRKTCVILFGVFLPQEICMPALIEDSDRSSLIISQHPELKNTKGEALYGQFSVENVLAGLQSHSRSPNRDDPSGEHPDPPPLFELWLFALRHYLNLTFTSNAFWMWRECLWWQEVCGGMVFVYPDWAPLEPYIPGTVPWHVMD